MTGAARTRLKIDVIVDSGLWRPQDKAKATVRRAVARAASMLSTSPSELAIVLTNDSAVRSLNRLWRGIDAATNVLSFPNKAVRGDPSHIGDIVLAYETVAREARADRKPLTHHLAHLAVHGFLHLVGYDHESDEEAEAMEQIERRVLRRLAIPDPYRPRARAPRRDASKARNHPEMRR
jgi:probable rRNA maturation factor